MIIGATERERHIYTQMYIYIFKYSHRKIYFIPKEPKTGIGPSLIIDINYLKI